MSSGEGKESIVKVALWKGNEGKGRKRCRVIVTWNDRFREVFSRVSVLSCPRLVCESGFSFFIIYKWSLVFVVGI